MIKRKKQVYEKDFKPRAKILKRRTGKSLRSELRGGKGKKNYYVSNPGTIAIIREELIEWYTNSDQEITKFLKDVLDNGYAFLEKCCE